MREGSLTCTSEKRCREFLVVLGSRVGFIQSGIISLLFFPPFVIKLPRKSAAVGHVL